MKSIKNKQSWGSELDKNGEVNKQNSNIATEEKEVIQKPIEEDKG
jgi:hypothetical protein